MISLRGAALFAITCSSACGGFSSSPSPSAPGADAGDDAAAPDAAIGVPVDGGAPARDADAPDAGPCDLTKPWQAPTALDVMGIASLPKRVTALPSPDERTLYLSAIDATATTLLYFSLRTAPSDPFGAPSRLVADFNVTGNNSLHPSVTAAGTELYYARVAGSQSIIYVATRPDTQSAFANARNVSGLGGTNAAIDPYITPDGSTIYFSDDVGANNGHDIYVATRGAAPHMFSIPQRLDGVGSVDDETAPIASRDELTLFFARKIAGKRQVFVASRSKKGVAFGDVAPVLPSADDVEPTGLSADGCTLYLTRTGATSADFLVARRPR